LPDPSHYPEQLTPLSATVWFEAVGQGLHEAMRELRGPFGGFEARTELGWAYEGQLDPEWEPEEDALRRAALELRERWARDIRPRVHAINDELRALRPERPSPRAAGDLLERAWTVILEQWKLHFLAVVPAQAAAELLSDAYVEAFGDEDPLAPYRLLDGTANETTEADEHLWRLAELARELDIDDVIVEYPAELVMHRLAELGSGRRLLGELGAYLERFGGRSRWHELSVPREAEQPWLTLESLRLFVEGGTPPRMARAGEAERLEREVLGARPELAETIAVARFAYGLKESHVYHIDYPGLLATREVLLGFGRRLFAEGGLGAVDDVWMLRREELLGVVAGDVAESPSKLVAERRGELERGAAEGPRPFLGAPPPEGDRHVVQEKFYGRARGVASDSSLRGAGASPGIGEGPARVVRGTGDFRRVEPGDVLVATTTTPAWTPLFPSLSGLVTETGGILSHAAIVAREYGIPAVVGAAGATRALRDGARVRVDGSSGLVETL
jgi:pyruvate,water dikinase